MIVPYVFQTIDKETGKPHPRWRFQYRDYLGRKQMRTGTTSRRETEKMALQAQAQQQMIRNRVLAPPKASDAVRGIDELFADYLAWGNTQGGRRGRPWGAEHARKRTQDLKFWKTELKLRTQVDLIDCQPMVERVIHRLHAAEQRSGKTTWNKVETLAAFCRWCLDRGYLDEDPLRRLKKINTDPVRRRRALTADEIAKLLS